MEDKVNFPEEFAKIQWIIFHISPFFHNFLTKGVLKSFLLF